MENMERFTPLYAITNNMEHVRFDEEDYFHVLVFYGLFYKRNRRHFPMFPYVIETLVEVWENSKLRGKTRGSLGEQHFNFSFSQTSTRVSITVWKTWKGSRPYTPSRTIWSMYALMKKTISTF